MNRWTGIAAACAAALMVAGGLAVQREAVIAASVERLERQAAALRAEVRPPRRTLRIDKDASPRTLLADALFLARQGGDARDPHRRAELLAADEAVGAVIARRPQWGEAWVVRSLVRTELGGANDPQATAALEKSYALAPFLRDAAEWRISRAFAAWSYLDPYARQRVINEAVIYAQLNGAARIRTFELARGTAAYVPLSVAWHARTQR
ncbi:hypothetical protein ABVV53_06895 [Novosphingobium sp. RD2P27]|uniref:Uncharacterized protein n=1 Tax=Novosphingobium kalidii TaxID=3230299 RepID=A0ABV2D000_9SPHN